MTATRAAGSTRLAGYACAMGAGTIWGTTGPLSTILYAQGAALTGIGFWRLALGIAGIAAYGLAGSRDLHRVDRRGWLLVGLGGGVLVALFEVGYQYAISGAGVAGAAALLYTAPVLVAVFAGPLLGERLTPPRFGLAVVVMVGAALTVRGGSNVGSVAGTALAAGVAGGCLAAISYAGTTLLARYAVPRYGAMRVLFLEILGGIVVLGVVLPMFDQPLTPPATTDGWLFIAALAAGTVILANVLFFNAARRIDAAPTAVAATIEPVVAALIALALFGQRLTPSGWLGLAMVVGGVAGSYLVEARSRAGRAAPVG